MADKTGKKAEVKTRRLPKGQRIHIRRLKEEARREGKVYHSAAK